MFPAVAISLSLHIAIACWLLLETPITKIGGVGSEGISVELSDGDAIEAIFNAAAMPAAANEANLKEGDDIPEEQVAVAATDAAPQKITETSELAANASQGELSAFTLPQPKNDIRDDAKAADGQGQDIERRQAQDALISGGTTSRGTHDVSPTESSTGASAGEFSHYAARVHDVVIRKHPHHDGHRGYLKIRFVIGQSGEVVDAAINMTSGNNSLDHKAITALRAMRFPPPPPDFTEAQRTYLTTFNFH